MVKMRGRHLQIIIFTILFSSALLSNEEEFPRFMFLEKYKALLLSSCCSLDQLDHFLIDEEKHKHDLTSVWLGQSVIGIIGSVLNSLCLAIFFIGRDHLLSSINVTIW